MNPEIKEKWIAALKSGKYVKGEGILKCQDGEIVKHCCLGVLCEIHREETGEGGWQGEINTPHYKSDVYASTVVLPEPVQKWAEFKQPAGEFCPDEEDVAKLVKRGVEMKSPDVFITEINDKIKGDDFLEIIPFIEKYF